MGIERIVMNMNNNKYGQWIVVNRRTASSLFASSVQMIGKYIYEHTRTHTQKNVELSMGKNSHAEHFK